MTYYGRAQETATRLVQSFKSGEVPKALSLTFIRHTGERHADSWSWQNQLITALWGYSDARGFRQWQTVGRNVRKGERAFYILAPIRVKRTGNDAETGEKTESMVTVGFKGQAVFGLEQTEGEPYDATGMAGFIDALPLVEVARKWGLTVQTYDTGSGNNVKALGFYRHGQAIALGVKNLAVWAHELIHAADDRLGELVKDKKQWRKEIVAELGAATILHCIGEHEAADDGAAWQYIESYANRHEVPPLKACQIALDRVCRCVDLILRESETIKAESQSTVAA